MMAKPPRIDPALNTGNLRRTAEYIKDELDARQKRRQDRERCWGEIDRQLAMKPENSHKLLPTGRVDARRQWMSEVELPSQAETLETLCADTRRLKFPSQGDFFTARAALTDTYLARYENAKSPIPNDKNDDGSILAQDNADRLAQAMVSHWHRQYDYRAAWDKVDADAFKYGFGVGRLLRVKARMMSYDATTTTNREQEIPVFVPRSAKRVYLDDNESSVMHEGYMLGPNIIQIRTQHFDDLMAAAKAGSTDPDDDNGGWRPDALKMLARPKNNQVQLAELEGDLVIDTSDGADLFRNVCATIALANADGGTGSSCELVRLRRRGTEFCSYIVSPYHHEDVLCAYPTSPLMKGMPIARAAAQQLNRVVDSGLLQLTPPVGYDKDDPTFAANGGPLIYPGAQWGTVGDIRVYNEVGGDPSTLFNTYIGLLQQYSDVTGVNAPRLGAQTKSHTTAFAKDAELTRGTIRTVDYVRSCLDGPMTRLLHMEYRMGLSLMRGTQAVYVDAYEEFVNLSRAHLPDIVAFKAIGAAAPNDQAAEMQRMQMAAQTALQVDAMAVQLGRQPRIDHAALVDHILRHGGWTDIDAITTGSSVAEGAGNGSEMGGLAGLPGVISSDPPSLLS